MTLNFTWLTWAVFTYQPLWILSLSSKIVLSLPFVFICKYYKPDFQSFTKGLEIEQSTEQILALFSLRSPGWALLAGVDIH